jgi:hypothetical protein
MDEFLFDLGVLSDGVPLAVFQVRDSIDVSTMHSCSMEEFGVSLPFLQPLHSGFLLP